MEEQQRFIVLGVPCITYAIYLSFVILVIAKMQLIVAAKYPFISPDLDQVEISGPEQTGALYGMH
jgi:hypothetical protein